MLFHCQNALGLRTAGPPQLSGKSCQESLPSVHGYICSFYYNIYCASPSDFTLIYVANHAKNIEAFTAVDNKEIEIMQIGNFLLFLKETKYLHASSLKIGKRKLA